MRNIFKRLHGFFDSRDTRSIEVYFELLNAWWLFILWNPSTDLTLRAISLITNYQDMLIIFAFIAFLLAIAALMSRAILLRVTMLTAYMAFYLLSGINLLQRSIIDPLGGFFLCQAVLASLLIWKIQARTGSYGTKDAEHHSKSPQDVIQQT